MFINIDINSHKIHQIQKVFKDVKSLVAMASDVFEQGQRGFLPVRVLVLV